ncbi:MAG: NupC/NupG family nucleoside CNT transporter, partial [Selenomonadaceae bacterium]|nr:NupC/NupG family nucleoside CNT transporter [Selenomonadaceae bacterium]
MFVLINLVGIVVFLALAVLFSKDRKSINRRTVGILVVLNFFVGWFLTSFPIGRELIVAAAAAFTAIVNVSFEGIAFALPNWVNVPQMNFITVALLPLLMIVPLFDTLTYIGIFPFIIKWIGQALSYLTRVPKFESFYAIEMMFLGNSDAVAVSSLQLQKMKPERCITIAMMSMSCVSAALIGAYIQMMPAEFVLTAIPLNVINALLVAHILQPTPVSPEEDTIVSLEGVEEKLPFFAFLSKSILGAGRLVFIVTCIVIAFVSLAKLIDKALALINPAISLESILGLIMFPFAWLMGLDNNEAFQLAQFMGTKLVTNEFVVMLQAQPLVPTFSLHMQCVLTV